MRRKKESRQEFIKSKILSPGYISIKEIADKFACSEVTVRTDLKELERAGILKRTTGGAIAPSGSIAKKADAPSSIPTSPAETHPNTIYVPFPAGKYYLQADAKQRIVKKAFEYINPYDTIMLDDSTTCIYLAQLIQKHPEKPLRAVTNSLLIAAIFSTAEHVDVHMLGGRIFSAPPSAMDNFTADFVNNYHVSKFFSGINRIDLRVGLTSADTFHAEIKKAMISIADQTFILADHSKFSTCSFYSVLPIQYVRHIITDNKLDERNTQLAIDQGIIIDIV